MGGHDGTGTGTGTGVGGGDRLVFTNYAKAHRHGQVVGQLPGGHAIPFGPYTLTQVAVFTAALVVLYLARGLWTHFGRVVDLLVLVGLPYGLAVAERLVRPEGRSPLRSVVALAAYAVFPRGGRVRGRPLPARPRRVAGRPARVFVCDLPDAPDAPGAAVQTASRTGGDRSTRPGGAPDQDGRRRPRRAGDPARRLPPALSGPAVSSSGPARRMPVAPAPPAGPVAPPSGRTRRLPPVPPAPAARVVPGVSAGSAGPVAPSSGRSRRLSPVPPAPAAPDMPVMPAVLGAPAVQGGPAAPTGPPGSADPAVAAGPATLADLLAPAAARRGVSAGAGEGR